MAKREREEEFEVSEVGSLSLASLLLRSLALSIVTVQRSLPIVLYIISASCTTIFTKRFRSTYIYTLA